MQKHYSFKRFIAVIIMIVQVGFLATAAITFGQDLRQSDRDHRNSRTGIIQHQQETENESIYQRARNNLFEFFSFVFGSSETDSKELDLHNPNSVLPLPSPPDPGDGDDDGGNG
ncbi:hypothetical protein GF406_15685 [candidate division KSB1 bacterium]|nr:hypothetical protein [candidate division KSB1 bacterium]